MFGFLVRVFWLACLSVAIWPVTGNALTCAERYPVPIDFELVVIENLVQETAPGQFTYSFRYVIETTVEPESGGVVLYNGEPPGTEFRSFTTVDNREAIFVSARIDGESFGSKKFIWQPSVGLLPGPVADFSYSVSGNQVTFVNESTNTNGVNIYYDWDFGLGASPFIFRGEEPPTIEYRQPGIVCVRLIAQEATGGFGEFDLAPLDQQGLITKEVEIELDAPIADFEPEVLGRLLRLDNLSRHPSGKSMSYTWDFGDSNTSTEFEPEHVYEQPGQYTIQLTVRDIDGNTDSEFETVVTEYALIIEASAEAVIEQNQDELIRFTVYNFERDDVGNLQVPLSLDAAFLEQRGVAEPAILRSLAQGASFTSAYTVRGLQAGDTVATLRASGSLASGGSAAASAELAIGIQPDVTLDIVAPSIEAVGEETEITVTVTNNEAFPITGARLDSLVVTPSSALTLIGSPSGGDGDPRVTPFTVGPGQSITFTFRYRADEAGVIDLSGLVTYAAQSGGRFAVGDQARFAVDTAALAISNLRMSGGPPAPGAFTLLRGTLSNVGNYDVSGIDFRISNSVPLISHLERPLQRVSESVSPRIALLAPGESQDFIIPIGVGTNVGDSTRYTLPLRFSGTATVGGSDITVIASESLRDNLDRSRYWVDILDETRALLVDGAISFFDDLNEFAEQSMIGGIAVGSGDALLAVLQRLGDGELAAVDFLGETVGDGGEQLTLQGKQMVNVAVEYYSTVSREQMLRDLRGLGYDASVSSVDVFASWMFDIEQAYAAGDTRRVTQLLAEPGIEFATGVGVEAAGARLFSNLLRNPTTRRFLNRFKKREVPDEDAPAGLVQQYIDDLDADWNDIPEGVPLTGQHALAAGVEGDQLAFMIDAAKRHGVTFFVRPRPATAARWARASYNAKPLSVKNKSVSEIDHQWLGYDAADEGLVVLQEPELPTERLRAAFDSGELDVWEDRDQVLAIIDRYNAKKAEWENRTAQFEKLNSVKRHQVTRRPNPDNPDTDFVEEVEQAGIKVVRNGREIITTVSLDANGRMIFDYNGKPVYSDIDLLSVATADGTNVPSGLHRLVLRESGYGFDGQHHATANTSDFPNAVIARNTSDQYLAEHMRDGEGGALLIIGPDATAKGYVEDFNLISVEQAEALKAQGLSDYDLYGRVVNDVTYTGGVQTR